jgi:hypothetical protein
MLQMLDHHDRVTCWSRSDCPRGSEPSLLRTRSGRCQPIENFTVLRAGTRFGSRAQAVIAFFAHGIAIPISALGRPGSLGRARVSDIVNRRVRDRISGDVWGCVSVFGVSVFDDMEGLVDSGILPAVRKTVRLCLIGNRNIFRNVLTRVDSAV